jgi:hypothetical protein
MPAPREGRWAVEQIKSTGSGYCRCSW